jgi:hypothetical protein
MTRSLAAALAAILVSLVTACGGSPEAGPMSPPNPHGWAITKGVGETFTDGFEVLRLRGDRPAVLDSVALVGSEGLELVGFRLAGPDRSMGAVQLVDNFPPRDPMLSDVRPANDTTITPVSKSGSIGWELLIGIKVVEEGYHVREGVRVDYTVDGERFSVVHPAQLVVCTSEKYHKRGDCPFPDEDEW